MKKILLILTLLIAALGLYLIIAKNNQKAATPSELPGIDIVFTITDGDKRDEPKDLGTSIDLASIATNQIVFTFDYLPSDYYTVIYLDGAPIKQPTQATLIAYGFDLDDDQDKDSPFIAKGSHTFKVMIYKTKEQGLLDLEKDRLYQVTYQYEVK